MDDATVAALEAARLAYKKARSTAQEMLDKSAPQGSSVMTAEGIRDVWGKRRFRCSECRAIGEREWKFCAHYGGQIIRFDDTAPDNLIYAKVTRRSLEPKVIRVKMKDARRDLPPLK